MRPRHRAPDILWGTRGTYQGETGIRLTVFPLNLRRPSLSSGQTPIGLLVSQGS